MEARTGKRSVAIGILLTACLCGRVRADSILFLAGSGEDRETAAALARGLGPAPPRTLAVRAGDLDDPIERGRLLAKLENDAFRVVVGDALSEFAAHELPAGGLLLLGVSRLPAGFAGRPDSAVVPSFAPAPLAAALREVSKAPPALLWTPEQASAVEALENALVKAGMKPLRREIRTAAELVGAVDGLRGRAGSIWLLGDGRLRGEASFSHLVEVSIAHRLPLVSGSRADVERGAYLSYAPSPSALAEAALTLIRRRGSQPWSKTEFAFPARGTPVFNEPLRRRWASR